MPSSRNIALTVHELEPGEFYWVVMEAVDSGAAPGEAPHVYVPIDSALEAYANYSNALVAGVAVMRRMLGSGPSSGPGAGPGSGLGSL
ncbi:hypothetical protein VLK31_09295 [Variovorax sp. H27-G14]|uniref:hypothetical protein n=1 Tax=Variovorax sp. H27-G14 TaxID=3111914 RepID=UPI0038FCF21F